MGSRVTGGLGETVAADGAARVPGMVERARTIAEEVLFPAALEVDARGVIPGSHFDLLAAQGFYGIAGEPGQGGTGVDFPSLIGILETLAGGCLTTTFTWIQHHSVVRGLTRTRNAKLREKFLDGVIRGELRGGVTLAGAVPQPPRLWARATDGGWLVSGAAPFVTGWGIIDLLLIAARNTAPGAGESTGTIVSGLLDAQAGAGITVEELHMVAAQASNTVLLRFEDYFLPAEQVTAEAAHRDFLAHQHLSSRLNGCLAMGVAGRCIRMIGEAGCPEVAELLHLEQRAIRERLDAGLADPAMLPAARAAASELAYRTAGALVAAVGSTGILARQHAQRLVREAAFTLVVAGRPEIRDSLLNVFGRAHG
jgi:alkylation response protein AidB-like acyl-CoA dehydrogenase